LKPVKANVPLASHPRFELARPVARDGQVRVFAILQANIQASSGERRDFLNPGHVQHRAAVDADEFPRIQFPF